MKLISSVAASIICIIVRSCFAQNDKPVNTLTELSKRTNLTCCSVSGSIAWKHQQLNNDGVSNQICLDKICNRPGYSVDNSTPGCFHLIINATSIDAAGLYQCNEVETSSVRGAYLVVYNFSCSVDFGNSDDLVEGDIVKFHCSVSWKGKWPFKIRLLDEVGKEIMQKDVINDVIPYYTSSFEVIVSKPIFPSYTIQFAFLDNEITDSNIDRSCPTVNWTSTARSVKYGPSIIKLSCPTEKCERPIDDTINCSADGNPIPELHWLDWDDKKITSGSVLELKSLGSHKYLCVATNIIRGESYKKSKNITVNVNSKPDVDGSRWDEAIFKNNVAIAEAMFNIKVLFIIVIIISVVMAVVAIIGLIAFFRRRKLCARNQTPSTLEQNELQPLQGAPLLGKEEAPEGDENLLPPVEQNDLNDQINTNGYISELGPHVTFRKTSENEGSSRPIHGSCVAQPVDSEITEIIKDEKLGAHPENSEGASLLGATLAGAEDKMRKNNSTLPSSAGLEVVLHQFY